MFTKNNKDEKRRGRGRPPGRTPGGEASRREIYHHAVRLITRKGYEAATLRDIAKEAGVSPALLYRYFPSKRAVVFELYDELSQQYAEQVTRMPPGLWRDRFQFALQTSLDVLEPHRRTIAGLVPLLVGSAEEGVFAPGASFSRVRVQGAFELAVSGARDRFAAEESAALGRILYLMHLAVLLWWALDRTTGQRATRGLLQLAGRVLPAIALALKLPSMRRMMIEGDALLRAGLFGEQGHS